VPFTRCFAASRQKSNRGTLPWTRVVSSSLNMYETGCMRVLAAESRYDQSHGTYGMEEQRRGFGRRKLKVTSPARSSAGSEGTPRDGRDEQRPRRTRTSGSL